MIQELKISAGNRRKATAGVNQSTGNMQVRAGKDRQVPALRPDSLFRPIVEDILKGC